MSWADNAKKFEEIQESQSQRSGTAHRILNYINEDTKTSTNVKKKTKSANANEVKSQVNIRISNELMDEFKILCKLEYSDVTTKLTDYIRKEVKSNKEKINEFGEKNKKNRV